MALTVEEKENILASGNLGEYVEILCSGVVQVHLASPDPQVNLNDDRTGILQALHKNGPNRWMPLNVEGGLLLVRSSKRDGTILLFLQVFDLGTYKKKFQYELYDKFEYNRLVSGFHYFEMEQCVCGLNFSCLSTAQNFFNIVQQNLASVAWYREQQKQQEDKPPAAPPKSPNRRYLAKKSGKKLKNLSHEPSQVSLDDFAIRKQNSKDFNDNGSAHQRTLSTVSTRQQQNYKMNQFNVLNFQGKNVSSSSVRRNRTQRQGVMDVEGLYRDQISPHKNNDQPHRTDISELSRAPLALDSKDQAPLPPAKVPNERLKGLKKRSDVSTERRKPVEMELSRLFKNNDNQQKHIRGNVKPKERELSSFFKANDNKKKHINSTNKPKKNVVSVTYSRNQGQATGRNIEQQTVPKPVKKKQRKRIGSRNRQKTRAVIDVDNIPEEWKPILSKAGIKKSDLRKPQMQDFIEEVLAEYNISLRPPPLDLNEEQARMIYSPEQMKEYNRYKRDVAHYEDKIRRHALESVSRREKVEKSKRLEEMVRSVSSKISKPNLKEPSGEEKLRQSVLHFTGQRIQLVKPPPVNMKMKNLMFEEIIAPPVTPALPPIEGLSQQRPPAPKRTISTSSKQSSFMRRSKTSVGTKYSQLSAPTPKSPTSVANYDALSQSQPNPIPNKTLFSKKITNTKASLMDQIKQQEINLRRVSTLPSLKSLTPTSKNGLLDALRERIQKQRRDISGGHDDSDEFDSEISY